MAGYRFCLKLFHIQPLAKKLFHIQPLAEKISVCYVFHKCVISSKDNRKHSCNISRTFHLVG